MISSILDWIPSLMFKCLEKFKKSLYDLLGDTKEEPTTTVENDPTVLNQIIKAEGDKK